MRRGWLLALLLVPATALAQEEPDAPQRAADKVLAAITAKDETALLGLAATGNPDPWRVADELCHRGEHDAAEVFARAAPRPDLLALPGYVAGRRGVKERIELRNALAQTKEIATADPGKALEILTALDVRGDDVASIRVVSRMGVARARLHQRQDAVNAYLDAADRSERIGWLAAASKSLGQAVMNASDIRAAVALGERLLALEGRRKSVPDEVVALLNLAWQYRNLGQREKARTMAAQARAALEKVGPAERDRAGMAQEKLDEIHAVLKLHLAHACWDRGEEARGAELGRKAAEELERLGLSRLTGQTRGTLGERLVQRGKSAEAITELTWARDAFEKAGDENGVAWTSGNLGWAHLNLGHYDQALADYQRGYEICKRMNATFFVATSLLGIGRVFEHKGDYEEALDAARRSLQLFRELKQRGQVAGALSNLGTAHWRLAQWDEAIQRLEEARRIYEELKDPRGMAAVLTNLGLVHQSLSEYAKAAECQSTALALQETAKNADGIARAQNNLAMIYIAEGRYALAMHAVERALATAQEIGNRSLEATTLGNLAAVCDAVGSHRRALALHEEALALKLEIGDRGGAPVTRMNIGRTLEMLGESDRAREALLTARVEYREVGDRGGEAEVLIRLGSMENRRDDFARARAFFSEAKDIFTKIDSTIGVGWTEYNLGVAYVLEGVAASAISAFQRSLATGERLGSVSLTVLSLSGIAEAHVSAGEHREAIEAARNALGQLPEIVGGLADDAGASARARFADVYVMGATGAARLGDAASFVEFVEAGRAGALLEWLKGSSSLRSWVVPEELRSLEETARHEEAAARVRYLRAVQDGHLMAIRARRDERDAARHEVAEVVRKIRGRARATADVIYPSADSLDEIQGRIRKGEALLLYALLTDDVAVLVVTPESTRIVHLGATEEIHKATDAIDMTPGTDRRAAIARLKKMLIDPLELEERTRRLLVSPDGFLSYVPLAMLDRSREIVYVPSGTTYGVLTEEQTKRGRLVLALGDPDYGTRRELSEAAVSRSGRHLARLPESRAEVAALGDELLLGAEASETRFRAAVSRSDRWRAVHLACHGLVDAERPMLSSLALAADRANDGLLTILDVFRMRIPSELVVLSACQTAEGQTHRAAGVVGFTRAFMFAGSPRVIVSLWKVDDVATKALMTKFYELWNPKDGSKGLSTAAALQQAQDHVASQDEWKDPYFWAAWQLWGLPD